MRHQGTQFLKQLVEATKQVQRTTCASYRSRNLTLQVPTHWLSGESRPRDLSLQMPQTLGHLLAKRVKATLTNTVSVTRPSGQDA